VIPLNIVNYPNPILKSQSELVTDFTDLGELIDVMFQTMYISKGLGLAAPQVGISKQIFVIGCGKEYTFINPKIVAVEGKQYGPEGCLSFPKLFLNKSRPNKVKIQAYNQQYQPFELEAEGLLARAILHEYDHLLGVLLIDNVENKELTKSRKILNALEKCYKNE